MEEGCELWDMAPWRVPSSSLTCHIKDDDPMQRRAIGRLFMGWVCDEGARRHLAANSEAFPSFELSDFTTLLSNLTSPI